MDSFSNPEMLKSGYKHNTIAQIMQTRSVFRIHQKIIIVRILGHLVRWILWVFELDGGGVLTITWVCHKQLFIA